MGTAFAFAPPLIVLVKAPLETVALPWTRPMTAPLVRLSVVWSFDATTAKFGSVLLLAPLLTGLLAEDTSGALSPE